MSVTPLAYSVPPALLPTPGPDRIRSVIDLLPAFVDLAGRIAKTEFVPTGMRNRPEAVLAALMSGAERGLGPMESLRSIAVIEGKPTLSSEAMRALVLAAGHEITIVESTAVKATVVGRRADSDSTSPPFTWTIDRARRARLASKDVWQRYPEAMLLARASSDLCKAVFPDVIAGLEVSEVLTDETTPDPTTARRATPRTPSARRQPELAAVTPQPEPPADQPPSSAWPLEETEVPGSDTPSWVEPGVPAPESDAPTDTKRLHAELRRTFPDIDKATRDRWRHALVAVVTRRRDSGPDESSTGLTTAELLALSTLLANVRAGQMTVADGPDGTVELVAGGFRAAVAFDPLLVTVGQEPPANQEPDE